MVNKEEIKLQVEHLIGSGVSDKFVELIENFEEEELCNRRNFTGHITASGVIVNLNTGKILLLSHKALGKWLPPGGHVERDDNSLQEASLREILEETGIPADALIPINTEGGAHYCVEINSHPIPYNQSKNEAEHYHHDFRFLFGYKGENKIQIDSDESLDYKWISIDDEYMDRRLCDYGISLLKKNL